jgi:hypothetical protein
MCLFQIPQQSQEFDFQCFLKRKEFLKEKLLFTFQKRILTMPRRIQKIKNKEINNDKPNQLFQ